MNSIYAFPVLNSEEALSAYFTGGDTQQNGLDAVASSVTVSGGSTPYTYATTLIDPRGVDRAAILTGGTTASPGFTPDLTGGGGVWTLRATVTDAGGRTVVATKAVTVGQSGFVLARSIVSDGTTDAAGSIVWGGVTFAAPNAGVEVVDGDLVLAGQASTDLGRSGLSTRTAALVTVSLNTLTGLASLGDRQVLIVVDVESYAPATSNEGLRVGLEQASAPIGSGSGGRGVAGGQVFLANLRASSILYQSSGGTGAGESTASVASIGGVGLVFAAGGVRTYASTSAFADAAAVLADTAEQIGGMLPTAALATLNQFVIAAVKPTAGGGAVCTIRGLQVWVR